MLHVGRPELQIGNKTESRIINYFLIIQIIIRSEKFQWGQIWKYLSKMENTKLDLKLVMENHNW